MNLFELLYLVSIAITAIVPLLLSTCRRFDDHIGGRLAFAMVAFVSWLILFDIIQGARYEVLPTTLLYNGGVSVFFLWYIGRFYRKQYHIWRVSGQSLREFISGRGQKGSEEEKGNAA